MTDTAEPFDAEKFIRDLKESGRQRRMVEAQRPSAKKIGKTLTKSAKLTRDMVEAYRRLVYFQAGLDPTSDYSLRFRDSSPAAADATWWTATNCFEIPLDELGEPIFYAAHPLVDPVRCSLDYIQRFVRAAMDHLEALGHLVKDDVGFRAPAVLSRAALEASAAACYLMDCSVPSEERLRRLWNIQCEQLTDDLIRSDNDGESIRAQREDVLSAAEAVGFRVERVRPSERRRTPKVLAHDGRGRSTSGDMIAAILSDETGRAMWRGLSDVAHSRSSGFMFLDDLSPRGNQIDAMRTESIAFHSMPALIAFATLGDHLEAYLGWDDISWREHFEQVILLPWSAASGAHDDIIRSNLGLPQI